MEYEQDENWVPHAPRATVRQKEFLLEFMEARPFLAQKEYGTAEGRRKAINDWSTLANALNNIAGGAQKSVSQWQKVGTLQCLLSEYDRRVLTVMGGWMRVVGFLSVIDPAEVVNPITMQRRVGLWRAPRQRPARCHCMHLCGRGLNPNHACHQGGPALPEPNRWSRPASPGRLGASSSSSWSNSGDAATPQHFGASSSSSMPAPGCSFWPNTGAAVTPGRPSGGQQLTEGIVNIVNWLVTPRTTPVPVPAISPAPAPATEVTPQRPGEKRKYPIVFKNYVNAGSPALRELNVNVDLANRRGPPPPAATGSSLESENNAHVPRQAGQAKPTGEFHLRF